MTSKTSDQSAPIDDPSVNPELHDAFQRSVEEGDVRLNRTLPSLLATGFIGGADVSIGVLALLVVLDSTGNEILAAVAFTVGLITLTLAKSELFTENFLVPLTSVVSRRATIGDLLRLWAGTLTTNLIGGWLVVGLIVSGFPRLKAVAVHVGEHYPAIGIGWRSFAGAVLGGAVITLMTWMERSTESIGAKLVAAIVTGFILAAAPLNHVVVVSLEMFAAMMYGAPFGYLDWVSSAAWYTLGNILGGVVFVTGLRLVQIGPRVVEHQRGQA
jgi:formate/nitrite transporter FocA (FNT family)